MHEQVDTGQDQEHNETEVKNWVIILTDEENEFMKLSTYLWFRKKIGNKEFFIIMIKYVYNKPQ